MSRCRYTQISAGLLVAPPGEMNNEIGVRASSQVGAFELWTDPYRNVAASHDISYDRFLQELRNSAGVGNAYAGRRDSMANRAFAVVICCEWP